jgi:ketosteroid isomerase-like protein
MDGILARHIKDLVMFDVPPPLQSKGIEAYKKTWDLFFQYSPGGEGSFNLEELKITAGDTVAFCHALLRIGGGEGPECRLTIGLQKVAGEWLIAHEHHSAPSAD